MGTSSVDNIDLSIFIYLYFFPSLLPHTLQSINPSFFPSIYMIVEIFKRNSLQITIEANKKVVDFLDITLDLRTEIYKPYKKSNSNLT